MALLSGALIDGRPVSSTDHRSARGLRMASTQIRSADRRRSSIGPPALFDRIGGRAFPKEEDIVEDGFVDEYDIQKRRKESEAGSIGYSVGDTMHDCVVLPTEPRCSSYPCGLPTRIIVIKFGERHAIDAAVNAQVERIHSVKTGKFQISARFQTGIEEEGKHLQRI
ncbi:hypothetical protein BKA93DRAFT_748301 [Sparassis latifolia]